MFITTHLSVFVCDKVLPQISSDSCWRLAIHILFCTVHTHLMQDSNLCGLNDSGAFVSLIRLQIGVNGVTLFRDGVKCDSGAVIYIYLNTYS